MGNAQSEAEIKTDKDKISDMFIAHVTALDTCQKWYSVVFANILFMMSD
jgi:hypothetical protein